MTTDDHRVQFAERALHERTQMLNALVAASPLPVVVIEVDSTVRLWNAAAERLFGWSAKEVVGASIPIVPFAKRDECASMRRALTQGEHVLRLETYRTRRDGSNVPVAIWAALLENNSADEQAMVLLFEDLTGQQRVDQIQGQLAAIVESSQDAIVGKTLDGIVTSWNHAAEALFGYTADEMIGQSITRIVPPDYADDVSQILAAIRRGERVSHFETVRVRKDGQYVDVSLTVSPIKDSTGRIMGASKIARDISARKRIEAERENLLRITEELRGEAEAANHAKDKFLAMLGHELRNPLSTVRNGIIAARCDPVRRGRALDLAQRGADQLTRLVDDLLDVARITQGRITLRRETLALSQLVERAIESARPLIDERAHAITLSLAGSDLQVCGDAVRLEQVISNLLLNAAKYTDVGGHITVSLTREGTVAVLRVRDTGIGMSADIVPRVFDLFTQADQAPDRAQGGLGIGLTLVKHLVQLHGGTVDAHSAGIGAGAEFVIRLPATPVSPPGARMGPHADGKPRARILMVEDNQDAAESMTMILELLGHPVRAVCDGPSALEEARANPPDVMLIDIGLPIMDGYEIARQVRQQETLRAVVLIALTGYGRDEDKQRALAAGFDYHLAKPIDVDKFQRLVAQLAAPADAAALH